MTLTVTHTSPITTVGTTAVQTGNAVSGQKQSTAFGSLLATLLGLAEQIAGQTNLLDGVDAETVNPQNLQAQTLQVQTLQAQNLPTDERIGADGNPIVDIPGLDIAALLGTAEIKPNTNGENPEPIATPQQLVAALITILQDVKGAVPTAQLTDASKAADAIGKLLAGTPETLTANATPNIQAGAQAEALAKLAEKFTLQAPELSAKLNLLSDKLQQLANPTPATAQASELHQTLRALFGEKQIVGKEANLPVGNPLPTGAAKGLDQSGTAATSPIDATKLDFNATRALNQTSSQATTSAPTTTTPAPTTTAPVHTARAPASAEAAIVVAAANGATPIAKSETALQSDALLLAQSNNLLGIKTDIAAAVKPMTAAYQPATQNLNMPHIAFEITRNMQEGMSRFQIRLDPPEMGRIDVKLSVDNAGNLHARMTVDRAETLDLLQRDARSLERALQQAGIEGGRTNLEFSLRQNPFARQDGQSQDGQSNGDQFSLDDTEADTAITDIPAAIYYRGTASPGGINMIA